MPRFKAVFLDVGGTLLQMGDPPAVYREILLERGHQVELQAVQEALAAAREAARAVPAGPLPDHSIQREQEYARRDRLVCELLERLGVGDDIEACRLAIWESWLGTRVFQQYPETISVLRRLKEGGYVVGAVSNWEPRLEALCANHGWSGFFDFVLASEAEGQAKPGPFLFEKALRLADVRSEEAVHVGDSHREDVLGAQAAGIAAVLLAREATEAVPHSPAITSLEELFPLLEASDWIQGRLGVGEGAAARFTELPWVREQARAKLGFEPHPGTLNLHLSSPKDIAALERLKSRPGVSLEPEAGFCAARCFEVLLEGRQPAVVIVPEVPGYPRDKLELLAPVRLRDALDFVDGSPATVVVPPNSH